MGLYFKKTGIARPKRRPSQDGRIPFRAAQRRRLDQVEKGENVQDQQEQEEQEQEEPSEEQTEDGPIETEEEDQDVEEADPEGEEGDPEGSSSAPSSPEDSEEEEEEQEGLWGREGRRTRSLAMIDTIFRSPFVRGIEPGTDSITVAHMTLSLQQIMTRHRASHELMSAVYSLMGQLVTTPSEASSWKQVRTLLKSGQPTTRSYYRSVTILACKHVRKCSLL